ncbi:phosphatidic acid phosphatase type 2/haloperoxidase [Lophiotrema nucula]|uniref:Phosphatidic acid phosphatase type 2/haloperoxidase n=1 Tax=Lophiotrema nucula TaxID=690887 RepID=A0A6A5YF61_9PLEO|nr:phosphatidic acid phosphatase type 2/haloperoxidase [Lophiotrema nucula]
MAHGREGLSRTWLSYCLDWFIVIVFISIAGAFTLLQPVKRDFSLTDKTISYPYRKDTISVAVLFIVAVVAPAAIIAIISTFVVKIPPRPGPEPSRRDVWKRKLWEVHATWLGLGLSLVLSFFLTQTMKNMFGKHRPDFLARCSPNIGDMDKFLVGGYTSEVLEGTSQLVSAGICISSNGSGVGKSEFIDGFRSFPSGHCTIAFAGLTYLSLFLAAKLAVAIPFLPHTSQDAVRSERRIAAAPPLYLLVIVLVPLGAAIYIASTRFTDYKHHGFDVLFGSVEGIICAWFAFRYYHLPISRGAGWAWGPRHSSVAFGTGMNVKGYGHLGLYKGDESHTRTRNHTFTTGIELNHMEPVTTGGGSYESHRALV